MRRVLGILEQERIRKEGIMAGSEPKHLGPGEAGTESRDAQSAWVGGGRTQLMLSAERFGAANEGSRNRRHPLAWAAAWVGGVCAVIALLVVVLR
jgi:hypothetical protein